MMLNFSDLLNHWIYVVRKMDGGIWGKRSYQRKSRSPQICRMSLRDYVSVSPFTVIGTSMLPLIARE